MSTSNSNTKRSKTAAFVANKAQTSTVDVMTAKGVQTVTVAEHTEAKQLPAVVNATGTAIAIRQRQPESDDQRVGRIHRCIYDWANEGSQTANSLRRLLKIEGLVWVASLQQLIDGVRMRYIVFKAVNKTVVKDDGTVQYKERFYRLDISPDGSAEFVGLDYPRSKTDIMSDIKASVAFDPSVMTIQFNVNKGWQLVPTGADADKLLRIRHDEQTQ